MKKTAAKITKPSIINSSAKIMKQARKKTIKVKNSDEILNTDVQTTEQGINTFTKKNKKFFMLPLFIIVIAVIIYFGKGYIVAATVNNQPISRLEIISQLETSQGKRALDQKISEMLIFQEAEKNKVVVTDQDVSDRVKQIDEQIKAQGQNLDDALKMQGLTRQDLNKQIKIELLVEKIIGKDIQITDEEINQSYEQNKAAYPQGTTLEQVKSQISDGLKQQKLGATFTTWMEDLKTKAKINYFISY